MSDPFVAEIRIFGFNFAPRGWAFCNGHLVAISQNTALFSLLGTYYGGDGRTTFGLPNLQGSAPIQWGQGPGLSLYDLGEVGGSQTVTLIQTEMPAHNHNMSAMSDNSEFNTPQNLVPGAAPVNVYGTGAAAMMASQSTSLVGGSQPHNNMQPYLTLNFCIAMQGIFPPRG